MLFKRIDILNFGFIILGSLIMAFGINGFLVPNHIATGGTAGLAIVVHHIAPLPVGIILAIINIPLLFFGFRYVGRDFAFKTVICILLVVIFVDLIDKFELVPVLSNELLLATLYGGVTIGIGLGLVFKGGASAGGGTILASILSVKYSLKTSTVVMVIDAIVVALAGIVFKSVELALWSLISIYVGSRLIDVILVGAQNQKIVHISSAKNLNELSQLIATSIGVSGTLVSGNALDNSEHKDIIFIMIDKSRLNALKQLVSNYDSDVKMIVMEASEILGRNNRI